MSGQGGELRRTDDDIPELEAITDAIVAAIMFMRGLVTHTHRHPQAAERLRAALDKVAPGWRNL